ncbi:MAG: DUF6600 domain-containing protein [Armatimonadota bacterium]
MKRLGCLVILAGLLFGARPAAADPYASARLSDARGNVSVRGAEETEITYVERNAVLREGDTLWTDRSGNAEIELESGTWVRLSEDTKLELQRLPPSTELRVWTGSVYVDVSDRALTATRLITPVGDVDVEPESVVRIDLSRDESARVSVLHGRARVAPVDGSPVGLQTGERTYLEWGRGVERPSPFSRDELDGFDRYHRERVDYYIDRPVPRELERDILGARDLNDYGTWVVVDHVRYYRPTCPPDWRPYSTGYWSYVPSFGYSWVDYSPWGYATSHYGRWRYMPSHGWLWAPGYVWGPSYVYWSNYGSYCGWAPLDPWGRPAYYGPGNFTSFNFIIDFRSWTFCPRDRFYYGRHHRSFAGHGGHGGRGGRFLFGGHEIRNNPTDFHLVRDFSREIGVPRDGGRGLLVGHNGLRARDSVLRLENGLPAGRLKQIENRFKVPGTRDRDHARRDSGLENLLRNPDARIDDNRILKGPEALKRLGRSNPNEGGELRNERPTSPVRNGAGRGNDRPGSPLGRGEDRRPSADRPGNDRPNADRPTPRQDGPLGNPGRGNDEPHNGEPNRTPDPARKPDPAQKPDPARRPEPSRRPEPRDSDGRSAPNPFERRQQHEQRQPDRQPERQPDRQPDRRESDRRRERSAFEPRTPAPALGNPGASPSPGAGSRDDRFRRGSGSGLGDRNDRPSPGTSPASPLRPDAGRQPDAPRSSYRDFPSRSGGSSGGVDRSSGFRRGEPSPPRGGDSRSVTPGPGSAPSGGSYRDFRSPSTAPRSLGPSGGSSSSPYTRPGGGSTPFGAGRSPSPSPSGGSYSPRTGGSSPSRGSERGSYRSPLGSRGSPFPSRGGVSAPRSLGPSRSPSFGSRGSASPSRSNGGSSSGGRSGGFSRRGR